MTAKPIASLRLGVLVSGSGSNLQAIIDAIAAHRLTAEIGVVVSNVASAGGLERARKAGIPAVFVDHKAYASRPEFDAAVVKELHAHGVRWVVLAGFMRIITSTLLDAFPMRVVNIHPALLPAFPGVNGPAQALAYGVRVAGCTVHLVDSGTDTGAILAQAVVPVNDDDDEDTLAKRILAHEHALLPSVLQWIAEGRVTVETREGQRPRVHIRGVDTARGLAP